METKQKVLVFGQSSLLARLTQILRASPQLKVEGYRACGEIPELGKSSPDVIIVDAAQVTPEQFKGLLDAAPASRSTLISIDPCTYQLTVLSLSCLEDAARIIELLSVSLSKPA
jgi:hypothetical protein